MGEWRICTIDELGTINRGKSKHRPRNDPKLYGGKYPFIQTADVKKANLYITDYSNTYSDVGLAQSKLWNKGTLCITIAANIAESSILGIDACFPDSVVGFIPYEEKADLKFVKYLLDEFKVYMQQISKGTTQDNLSLEKLRRIKFKVPDYPTQVKIANILSGFDDQIENNNLRIKLLEEIIELLYKHHFSSQKLQKNSQYVRLSEILSVVRGVSYSTEEIECEEGDNLINLKNIQSFGGFRSDGTKKYRGSYKADQIVKSGDLIMGVTDMTQDRRTVGAVALVPEIDGVSIISADLVKINSELDNIYLYAMFRYGNVSKYISQFANGANVLHLKPQAVLNTKVLLPNKRLIREFSECVRPLVSKINRLNQANENLVLQRDMLLPRLMSGKLEV